MKKGRTGFILALALLPLAVAAQVPVYEGSSGGYQGGQSSTPASSQSAAGLSLEGQLMQQLYQLQQEVSMLRGLVEEQEHRIKQMEQDQLDRYQDIDRRLSSLTNGGGQQAAPSTNSSASAAIDASAPVQPPAGGSSVPAPAAQGPADPAREKLMYDAAFDLVKQRDFEKAALAFNAFVRRYPGSEYAGNAQYWLGEVYLAQSDLQSAGTAFAKVPANFPGHRKEADALYKLADVERRLGNADKARQLYQEVLSKHPNTSAAQLARRDLETLG